MTFIRRIYLIHSSNNPYLSLILTKKINIVMLMLFICINLLSVYICCSVLDLLLCLLTIATSFCAFVVTQWFCSFCIKHNSCKLWSERENQQDATVRCLLSTLSQHVSGIIMPIFRRPRRVLLHMVCCAGTAGCGW